MNSNGFKRPPSGQINHVVAPYIYVPESAKVPTEMPEGPTSFTAVGGDYNKRHKMATLNEDLAKRVNEN